MHSTSIKGPLSVSIAKLLATHYYVFLVAVYLHMLPTQAFDSFPKIGTDYPRRACNMRDMAEQMSASDLRNLVAAWAAREGLPPVAVLRSLETSSTWPNSHQLWKSRKSTNIEDDPDEVDQRIPVLKFKAPGQPINRPPSHFPPPTGNFLPPSLSGTPISFNPLRVGKLQPPPDAQVYVESATERLPPIPVAVSPGMGIGDALRQASIKFEVENPSSSVNYYRTSVARHRKLDCYIVESVGDIANSRERAWKVTVKDPSKKVLSSGRCLPSDQEIEVQPGTTIALSYVKKGR